MDAMLYECGVRYGKMTKNGIIKAVTELYLVDAVSFTEAEGRITKEMGELGIYASFIPTIKRTNYAEVVRSNDIEADKWFKVKVDFITVDEKTGKERLVPRYYIVHASDIDEARRTMDKHMQGTISDYVITTLDKTKIVDVFNYKG